VIFKGGDKTPTEFIARQRLDKDLRVKAVMDSSNQNTCHQRLSWRLQHSKKIKHALVQQYLVGLAC